jgi:hypothetical protein
MAIATTRELRHSGGLDGEQLDRLDLVVAAEAPWGS